MNFKPFLLLCALALPLQAQTPSDPGDLPTESKIEDKPLPWQFDFDATSEIIENRVSWQHVFDERSLGNFAVLLSGKNGVNLGETYTFYDATNQKIAVLKAIFNAQGKIVREELRDANNKLLKTTIAFGTSSKPAVTQIAGSGVTISTRAQKGFLVSRDFVLQTPTWTGNIISSYDARGRHSRVVFVQKKDGYKNEIVYSYNALGLERFSTSKTPDEPGRLAVIKRDARGKLLEVRLTEDAKMRLLTKTFRDAKGALTGMRMEDFAADGSSMRVVETRDDGKTVTTTETDEFERLVTRRVSSAKTNLLISFEEFQDGKPFLKTEFDAQGKPATRKVFGITGLLEQTRTFDKDGNLLPPTP